VIHAQLSSLLFLFGVLCLFIRPPILFYFIQKGQSSAVVAHAAGLAPKTPKSRLPILST
jgi:hypothetical protein